MLIKALTDLNGVSGFEDEVREFIKKEAIKYADTIDTDTMGNVIAYKKGKSSSMKVMLSAHMDEVGFMITGYGEYGTLKFRPVGGIDERILPGKRLLIGDKKLPGVIGYKPIHLQEIEERNSNIKLKRLYIDIGADKKEEAEKQVNIGDIAVFYSEYQEMGTDCIKAKALDDRVGCAALLEALKGTYDFDLYACFTVQEEVGLRGSEVAAYQVEPDIAIIVEGTTCSDVPDVEKQDYSTIFGGGAALTIMDRTAYGDKNFVHYIYQLAKSNKLNIQFKGTTTGGNDAGKIQRSRKGVITAAISVPCRYIHSPVSMMRVSDFESVKLIVKLVLEDLYKDKLDALKNNNIGRIQDV